MSSIKCCTKIVHAFFTIFAHVIWCNRELTTFKRFIPQVNLSFFMNKQCSILPHSRTISPNSTSSSNNSPKVISHKSFSCKRNSIFIFHVWKLLPFNYSILWALEMDAMIMSRIMSKNKTLRALKLSTKCFNKKHT